MTEIKHKKKPFLLFIICLFCCGMLFVTFQKMKENKIRQDYSENLSEITYKMINGSAEAEIYCDLIRSVWYNSIYKNDDPKTDKYTKDSEGRFYNDFNDAMNSLFDDSSFLDQLHKIKKNQDEVIDLMKQLRNPPSEYEEAYLYLQDYFEAYLQLTNMALNPIGSYNSFSEDFNDVDEKVFNYYQKMRLYLD